MGIIIERASVSDAEELIAFIRKVGGETDNLTFGSEGLPFCVKDEENYIASLNESNDGIMLVAKDSGVIVGNASLLRQPRRMSHRGELAVSVLKSHWNRGIGSKLIERLLIFAKDNDFDLIDLEVRCDNISAIQLYKKYGFRDVGRHPSFFKINGEEIPALFMCLKLR